MKFTLLSAAGLLTATQVAAVTIVTPWAQTVWTAGGKGDITWNATAADAGLKCDIQMMNGEYKNSNMVAQVSNPETPLDCSVGKFQIYPLNDFAAGDYWIRIGQAPDSWAYSGVFKFDGKGTSKPFSVVGVTNPSSPVTPAASSTNKAASSSGALAKNAASKTGDAAEATETSAAVGISMSNAAIALGAIAAIAVAL
ncbi:hypothetical protein BDB01DRAFT_780103 [Pilobolus umbonatus]|nr:hypothetical protein BDB01DRAFT_780103 [Pilobolus umbonatus]